MNTNVNSVQAYPFAWLDELIEITLHPARLQLKAITPKHLEKISAQLLLETKGIEYSLKAQTFGLTNKSEIQTVVEQYYIAGRELRRQATSNLSAYTHNVLLTNTGKAILSALDDLSQRISLRYQNYLPHEQLLSPTAFPAMLYKLLIKLSGDQIGIVAKAAFQAGLIPAKSLREAFRLLAPHLSTERKSELSAESMRSNSGRAEKPDLDIVLGHLDKLTHIIQGYYRRR